MQEKRLTHRLTRYWESLPRTENDLPSVLTINPSAISDIWPQCATLSRLEFKEGSFFYEYEYLGEELRKIYGSDLTGQKLNPEHKNFPAARILKRTEELISQRLPMYDDGNFINSQNQIVKYRSCMLPFGQKGQVGHVVLGLSWRRF